VRYLQTVKLVRPIGRFGYSNANYQTLGLIVQVVSGQSYETYIAQRIFAPLEMQTSFASQDEAQRHGMAMGYRWVFGFPMPATLPSIRAELPAGFLICSAEDMAHYLIAQMNGGQYHDRSILSPQGIAFVQTRSAGVPYGNGWDEALNGGTLVNQDGATANFQASVFFDPKARVGVFVAANVMNGLDGLSSPRGSVTFAAITTRGMAQSVLSLATQQPLPDQGWALRASRCSLICSRWRSLACSRWRCGGRLGGTGDWRSRESRSGPSWRGAAAGSRRCISPGRRRSPT
jgi:CubicO group peptidase (beta-lactamase class C family)